MHRDLKRLLHEATGVSQFVVALFMDVRGFSSFARLAESSEAAVFLRHIYTKVLDDYFPEAAFFKPTGDGLLIVRTHDTSNLGEVVNASVETSLQLVADFPNLCANDAMINFPVPEKIGIGLARGAATALISKRKVLDYSGRPLNLAARLMDVARPSGVVFDSALGVELLDETQAEVFSSEDVFIRGIAEDEPLTIYVSPDVQIGSVFKQRIGHREWIVDCREEVKFSELRVREVYRHFLKHVPSDPDNIEMVITHTAVLKSGRAHRTMKSVPKFKASYVDDAGTPVAQIDYRTVVSQLQQVGVKDSWTVEIEVRYLIDG